LTKIFIVDYNNTFLLIVNQKENHKLLCIKCKSEVSRVYSNVCPKSIVGSTGGRIPEMACRSRGFIASSKVLLNAATIQVTLRETSQLKKANPVTNADVPVEKE
jgi:hypothetical protein